MLCAFKLSEVFEFDCVYIHYVSDIAKNRLSTILSESV